MKKISIIIPNYNGGKYLNRCLESVLNQNYKNIEIIIVDDGSIDESKMIIENFVTKNPKVDVSVIYQNNMNGAVARNNGLNIAEGEYILFIDSDDVLANNVIKRELELIESSGADLLVGNYEVIDEHDKLIEKRKIFGKNVIYSNNDEIFTNLCDISPVPTNKIYKTDIIKNNNIYWGNVRIGQDLNFYLKYLSKCKKVVIDVEYMYKYRITGNSVSRTYSYKILDITNSFDDIKNYYYSTNNRLLYDKFIPNVQLYHYDIQLSKVRFFKKLSDKLFVLNYFKHMIKSIDYTYLVNKKKFHNYYKKTFFKINFKLLYIFLLKVRGLLK